MIRTLSHLLDQSARRYPRRIAVRYKGRQMTYSGLQRASSQLGRCLLDHGLKPGERVGVFIDKSIEAVIAIFGILKAGGCYVPLDSMSPPERLRYILNDCTIRFLAVTSGSFSKLEELVSAPHPVEFVYCLDECPAGGEAVLRDIRFCFRDEIFLRSVRRLTRKRSGAGSLAYILYTSGSTGEPKGVMITHKASLAFVSWAFEYFRLRPDDRIAAFSPLTFDLSVFDIFACVRAGARLCIVPPGMCSFPVSLAGFLEHERITCCYTVPSILTQLVLYGSLTKRKLGSIRRILFAGEVFPRKHLDRLVAMIPGARYYNLFGPTETNVCTCYPVRGLDNTANPVPIGRPVCGDTVSVVKSDGTQAARSEIGELYVSGPTLMQGYWGDGSRTASALVRHPWDKKKTAYKTGDLVSVNRNGDLEFHGRADTLIKKRGYRIELGEIESVLHGHPLVKEAVALASAVQDFDRIITAYVVIGKAGPLTASGVKRYCGDKLPAYMVPDRVVCIPEVPRTPNGKIDRRKLIDEAEADRKKAG